MKCRCGKAVESRQGTSTCSCGNVNTVRKNGDLGFVMVQKQTRGGFRVVKGGELRKR